MGDNLSRREFIGALGTASISAGMASAMATSAASESPHVVFVTGDDEYRSEVSMRMIAGILEARHRFKCSTVYAVDPATGQRNPKYQKNIEGLEVLEFADLAVFFLRFRALPDNQLKMILDYVNSSRPIVGLRTSTHAFRYPRGHKNARYNVSFGQEVFGQKWISHEGSRYGTRVLAVLKDHPIMRGVEPEFWVRSWLYNVIPLHGDCVSLALGYATETDTGPTDPKERHPKRSIIGTPNPVAWTKTYKGGRVFFTTLGHPKDFEVDSIRRLLINGIYWA
ncbi:MAG: ThuA domain-containing protein, partial [Planctomycetota bacterium]